MLTQQAEQALGDQEMNRFACLRPNQLIEAEKQSVVELALAVIEEANRCRHVLDSPTAAKTYLTLKLSPLKYEAFAVVFADSQNQVRHFEILFTGTLDKCAVYPRIVAQRALELNAGAVMLAHNHPSGVPEPSTADIGMTHRLVDALSLFDIRVLDHIVVGGVQTVSMAERGLL